MLKAFWYFLARLSSLCSSLLCFLLTCVASKIIIMNVGCQTLYMVVQGIWYDFWALQRWAYLFIIFITVQKTQNFCYCQWAVVRLCLLYVFKFIYIYLLCNYMSTGFTTECGCQSLSKAAQAKFLIDLLDRCK